LLFPFGHEEKGQESTPTMHKAGKVDGNAGGKVREGVL